MSTNEQNKPVGVSLILPAWLVAEIDKRAASEYLKRAPFLRRELIREYGPKHKAPTA